jgi:hypothetical protein
MLINYEERTPMQTRARNKSQHPGAPDAPKPRRSHAEMEKIRQDNEEQKQAEQDANQLAVERVANIEDTLREEDIARNAERQISAQKQKMKAAVGAVRGMCPCVHGKESSALIFD